MQSIYNAIDSGQYDAVIVILVFSILVYLVTRNRTESRLCKAFVMATYPVVWIGRKWMERIERIDRQGKAGPNREPTVSDIRPAGTIRVRAMGENGVWVELHDYPLRLLPGAKPIETHLTRL